MALGPAPFSDSGDDDQVIAAINTTPLVDVMLVLLIIFLITIPVVNYSVPVQLPKERLDIRESKPENIVLSVDAAGNTYWNDARLASPAQLLDRLKSVAQQTPQPEVHVRGDRAASYEPVGRIVLACQRAGIAKLAFLTEPPARQ